VLIAPVRVQGEGAAEEIAAAIEMFNGLALPIDCLVITRGGGSMEDLWSFNEEPVVRAIAASRIPTISAIGHEIDVTLADLAADVRALTPSEAAELVAPEAEELTAQLRQIERRFASTLRSRAHRARMQLEGIAQRGIFRRPYQRIFELARRLDELDARSQRAIDGRLCTAQQRMNAFIGRLESLSPLAVLQRGYSLTQRTSDGRVIRNAAELASGESIATRLARGRIVSRVERIEE
jgi:exodeoxyribonuclease VII large subunit